MKPSSADRSFDFAHSAAETGETGETCFVVFSLTPPTGLPVSLTWVQALVNRSPLPFARFAKEDVSHPPYPPDEAPMAVV